MKNNFLKLQNIGKVYNDGYIALKDFNLSIKKGEFVTLLGPSGCGKTTTLKMIAGFETPTSGKILINNVDIKDVAINKRPTATVFQDYALFPNLSVLENVSYGLKMMRKPLKGISKQEKLKVEHAYKDAVKKAAREIKKIEKDQKEVLKDISQLEKIYAKYPQALAIKNMRYQQYVAKIDSYLTQMTKKYGESSSKLLTRKHILKDNFVSKIKKIINLKRPSNYNSKKLNEYEKKIFELKKWYEFKKPLDIKIDKLRFKYNDLDQWVSYWANYPTQVEENYEKKYTTRRLTKKEILKAASQMIDLVGLKGNENKYPEDLSGGMRQRVALARALVVEPDIILLDEPLSALDAKVRLQMQNELKRIHNELKLTFILVTHDQQEALSLSNKIVVMSKGKIEQVGTPKNIYDTPSNTWVANFIGTANMFDGTYLGNQKVTCFDKTFNCRLSNNVKLVNKNDKVHLMVRPEDVIVCKPGKDTFNARVVHSIYKGEIFEAKCLYKKTPILLKTTNPVKVGDLIGIKFAENSLHIIPIEHKYDDEFFNVDLNDNE